ncbi:hypothetical protein F3087_17765 [Nocardia colli]|uniref:Uncharacterized protein n=1 Tax=Nocardia colli TaxID=2545717 RepID=A0A5N0EGZ1_9NOCA|nr:hypothetical protein [Nocardia colli]KAA8887524.1 hypothetical protein F3087_17765 [Nocardia colli]
MAKHLAGLFAVGFSVLLIASSGAAHASPAGDAGQAAEKQAAKNERTWFRIADLFCSVGGEPINPQKDLAGSRKQFSDSGIREYDAAFKITPLQYRGGYDAVDAARSDIMGKGSKFAPPLGSTDADLLRQWRYGMCNSDEFRREWSNALKTEQERLGTKLKPGMDTDAAILDLYDEKMDRMLKVLKAEEKDDTDDL